MYAGRIFFPEWLFGEWLCSSKELSYTETRLAKRRRGAADSSPLLFSSRWYSTLPDDASNSLRVALGSLPRASIVADVGFNFRSLTSAQLGRADAVRSVEYDPRGSPDKLEAEYVDGQRCALYLSASRYEPTDSLSREWYAAECCRYTSGAFVSDSQTISRFSLVDQDTVLLTQKVGIYLSPLDEMYFAAGNQAVALYTYETRMQRQRGADGAVCVVTPKGVQQCA